MFDYINDTAKNTIFGWIEDDKRIPNVFEDRQISELIYDVFNLVHDYDLYASGDTGKKAWLEKKRGFKFKWLQSCDVRARRIVDECIDTQMRCKDYENYDTSWMPLGTSEEVYQCSLMDCCMRPDEYCSSAKEKR